MRIRNVILALLCALGCGDDDGPREGNGPRDGGGGESKACIEGAAEEHRPADGAMHVSRGRDSELTYDEVPPTGGTHSECWLDYRVYEQEVEDARFVHNLEHGGIVLLYRCDDGCPDELAALRTFVEQTPRTLLSPYAALPTRFAVLAWEYRLLDNCLDLPAIQAFYDAHFNRGREDIPGGPPELCR